MKLTNLIWVLALAGAAVAGCNSGPPITNVPTPGTGGTPGSGGTPGGGGSGGGGSGGAPAGACTNEADESVYADLSYTNDKGESSTGTEAASAIGSDCVRGSASSVPPIPTERGCGTILQGLLGCALATPPSCTAEQVDELATCVEDCTQETISEITDGGMLTQECIDCYGGSVACSTAKCARECANDAASVECVTCRCDQNCTGGFEDCSGITSTDCD